MERRLRLTVTVIPESPGARDGEDFGIDVDAVCTAMRAEVHPASEFLVERFAEVLTAFAASADLAPPQPRTTSCELPPPLPDDVARRLLFACTIIFPEGDLECVHAFILRHLQADGLLRPRFSRA